MIRLSGNLFAIGTVVLTGLAAAGWAAGQGTAEKKYRKVHRAVIEVTAEGSPQWESVLNNIENLQKAFAPEPTEVEVVAHGKGLAMLQRTNASQSERMARIAAAGVKFAACENTMRRMKVQKSELFDFVVTVDSGVAELVRKQEAGWAYLKGGG
jgi:intracellular sulfur oxidation DsrE/DsrF family protein